MKNLLRPFSILVLKIQKQANQIRDGVTPECSRCGKRYFVRANHRSDLGKLKAVDAYRAEYDHLIRLCGSCWTEIRTLPCSLCSSDFDVLQNSREALLANLTKHGVSLPDVKNAKHVCPRCKKRMERSSCSRCKKAFLTHENKAFTYMYSADVRKWLCPYSEYYSTTWVHLCPNCYKESLSACADVQKRLERWAGESKSEFIHGFRTVTTLGRVDYRGTACSEPAQVENYLALYSAQLGGNGFVKYYWQKHEERHAEKVLAGYSENDNPYYRTEYSTERWFTGYATAVDVEPFKKETSAQIRPVTSSTPKAQDVRLAVLDGLNICCWSSRDELSPDIGILLSLCIGLAEDDLPFFCFFDANTPHLLRERADAKAEKLYVELLHGGLSSHFAEVPGRKRADEFILLKANCDGGHVISNDQFRDYQDQYVWLSDGQRLLKGTVADNHLLIPDLQLDRRIRKDLTRALTTLKQKLKA